MKAARTSSEPIWMMARDGWRGGVGSLDGLLLVLVESKLARLNDQIPRVRDPAGTGAKRFRVFIDREDQRVYCSRVLTQSA